MALSVLASSRAAALPCRRIALGVKPAGLGRNPIRIGRSTPFRPVLPTVDHDATAARNVSCNVAIGMGSVSAATGMFTACTAYAAALYSMMLVAPVTKTFQNMLKSNLIFVPIGLAYLFLLVQAWSPDSLSLLFPGDLATAVATGGQPQFFPKLAGIMTLFSRPATVPSFWAHLLAINLFTARWCYLDGMINRVPTLHSVLLTAVFGPLGYISHHITKAGASKRGSRLPATSDTASAAPQVPPQGVPAPAAEASPQPPPQDSSAPPAKAPRKRGRKANKITAVPAATADIGQPSPPPPPPAKEQQPPAPSPPLEDTPAEAQAAAAAAAAPEEASTPPPTPQLEATAVEAAETAAASESPPDTPGSPEANPPAEAAPSAAAEEAPAAAAAEEAPAAAAEEAPAAAAAEEAPAAAAAEEAPAAAAAEEAPAAAAEEAPAAAAEEAPAAAAAEEAPAAAEEAPAAAAEEAPAAAAAPELQGVAGAARKASGVVMKTDVGTITLLPY